MTRQTLRQRDALHRNMGIQPRLYHAAEIERERRARARRNRKRGWLMVFVCFVLMLAVLAADKYMRGIG